MAGQQFDDVEPEMGKHWGTTKSTSKLGWDKAKHAARDAWERIGSSTSSSSRDNMSGAVGQPQAYPGHSSSQNLSEDDNESILFAQSCRTRYAGRNFDDVETDLRRDWDTSHRGSSRTWENVKDSVRRAWHKVERAIPGDADRDGR
jgi:hypothetical protein